MKNKKDEKKENKKPDSKILEQQRAESKKFSVDHEKELISKANKWLYGSSMEGRGDDVFAETLRRLNGHSRIITQSAEKMVWSTLRFITTDIINEENARTKLTKEYNNDMVRMQKNQRHCSFEKKLHDKEKMEQITRLVREKLPEETQLWYFIKEERPPSEVGEYYNISAGTARVKMYRCRKRVKELCKKYKISR